MVSNPQSKTLREQFPDYVERMRVVGDMVADWLSGGMKCELALTPADWEYDHLFHNTEYYRVRENT